MSKFKLGDCLAGIDYGTTGVKAAIFDLYGQVLGAGSEDLPILFQPGGGTLQPVEIVFTAGNTAFASAFRQANIHPDQVKAIGISQQRSTFIPVSKDGEPLMDDFILWMDMHGIPFTKKVLEENWVGEAEFYNTSGLSIRKYVNPWCKILWIKQAYPDIFEIARFEEMQTVLLRMLGAESSFMDLSTASSFALLDIEKANWSKNLCEKLGIPIEKLSPLCKPGTIVGALSKQIAEQLGLDPGVPLVLGGGDQQCAAIGAGAINKREGFVGLGTGACVEAPLKWPMRDPKLIMSCLFHAVQDHWALEGHTQASAVLLKWFRDQFGQQEIADAGLTGAFNHLTELASTIAPGADGLLFLPMFNGSTQPETHPEARGAITGITLQHGKPHFIRALLEGISLEIRWIMERIGEIVGGFDVIRIAGGASSSPLWNQINSDIWGLPVLKVATSDAAALGAAIQSGISTGLFSDIEQACHYMTKVTQVYEPDLLNMEKYDEVYSRFMSTYYSLLNQYE